MNNTRCLRSAGLTKIPLFLAPAFAESSTVTPLAIRSSSSTSNVQVRKKRDLNKRRGESVIRSTGPRHRLPVQDMFRELPKPQAEKDRPLDQFSTNPNHGLYGFFNKERETVVPSEREELHGRAWETKELMFKSFEDLHSIYWQAVLDINVVQTRALEHKRLKLGFGRSEINARLYTLKETLINIRRVLKNRQEAWEEAHIIKEKTETIQGLDQYLFEKQEEAQRIADEKAASRIPILSEPEPFQASPTSTQELSNTSESQGQPVLPPRPN